MPWTPEDAKKKNKKLTDKQAVVWAKVANRELATCLEEGGEQSDCEGRAIRIAHTAASRAYTKERSRMHITDFDEKNIQKLTEGSLQAIHDHTHELAKTGQCNEIDVEKLHGLCAKEFGRRDLEQWHQTLLQYNRPRGLYIAQPHGDLLYQGKKGSLARAKNEDLSGKWVIVSGRKAYGEAMIGEAQKVNPVEFDARFEEHRVTVKERNKWWSNKKTLWLYPIHCFIPYPEPTAVDVLSGVQVVMDGGVRFKDGGKARHDKTHCMLCEEGPQVDILWADERGRAWFCAEHAKAWLEKGFEGQDVVRAWRVEGEVPEKIGDQSKPLWSAGTEYAELLKQVGNLRPQKTLVRVTDELDSKVRRLSFAEKSGAEIVEERVLGPVVVALKGGRGFMGSATVVTYKENETDRTWQRYDYEFEPPVLIEGKGENSWDLEADAVYSISVPLESDDEAGYHKALSRIAKGFPTDRLLDQKGSDRSGNWGHSGLSGVHGGSSSGGGLARIGSSPGEPAPMRQARARWYRQRREVSPELPDSARQEVISGIQEVMTHGLNTGNEAAVMLYLQGNKINETLTGTEDTIEMADFVKEYGDTLPIIIHNHPSSRSFSQGDVQWLFNRDVKHLIVVGHDGTLYRMSRTDKTPDTKWMADIARTGLLIAYAGNRPSDMSEDEFYAGQTAIETWGNIFFKDKSSYVDRVKYGSMTEREAGIEHFDKVNQAFADNFNLDYERIDPS